MLKSPLRLTIVQYAGDFREAAERLSKGGPETYRAQQHTVEYVENLATEIGSVTTITGFTDQAYDVTLPSGAKAIGVGFVDHLDGRRLAELTAQSRPDLLMVRGPIRPVILQIPLKWADLITDWIADTSTSRARLATQSFANR